MTSRVFFYGSLCACLVGCARMVSAQDKILTPSELNASVSEYSGRSVVVRGYVTLGPEAHSLYESEQLKKEFARRWDTDKDFDPNRYAGYCLTIANPDLIYRKRDMVSGKTITVRGRFVGDYLNGRVDFGACPLSTAIIIDAADLKARYPEIFR
ncbi:hypothetical protein [Xanthomonas sontii]|uniref:hypothetical protein n=1 Tax=Xanthomonas sontii TaxID=2650745 RepID=UPI00168B3222|nr:hypothetical protein [Xanthomonas sontii]